MKIALVSPYDFAYPGGVTHHIAHLEHQFTKKGHEVKILAPASKAVSDLGDRFILIGKPRPIPISGSIARITISPWLSSRIKTVLNQEKFDIIHLHEPLVPMLCTTVLRLSKSPTMGTFHASESRDWYDYGTPIAKFFLKKWFRKLNGKIAVSDLAKDCICKHFPGYYNIIPNGVDLEHFSPKVAPIEDFCDGKLNILFVGRLEKRKGFDYLLKAYQQVKKEIPNSRLIVVGPGIRLRHKYEKRVKRGGLADIVFTGYVSYKDLPRYYKTADVFCAPATGWESFGIILLEAMAVGKPIVASNVGGYATLITPGTEGYLVPPKDEQALAESLIAVLKDDSLRQKMGANGRRKAQEYSWENVAQRVLDYYTSVLNESSRREKSAQADKALA